MRHIEVTLWYTTGTLVLMRHIEYAVHAKRPRVSTGTFRCILRCTSVQTTAASLEFICVYCYPLFTAIACVFWPCRLFSHACHQCLDDLNPLQKISTTPAHCGIEENKWNTKMKSMFTKDKCVTLLIIVDLRHLFPGNYFWVADALFIVRPAGQHRFDT